MTSANTQPSEPEQVTVNPAFMQWRYLKNRLATVGVSIGGLSVIFAVVLIFFYLLWVVLPLFQPARMSLEQELVVPGADQSRSLLYAVEEQAELGMRISDDGIVRFFDMSSGAVRLQKDFAEPLISAVQVDPSLGLVAVQAASGDIFLLKHQYRLGYPEGQQRTITPSLSLPYGDEGISMPPGKSLAVRDGDDALSLAVAAGKAVYLKRYEKVESFLDDGLSLEETGEAELVLPQAIDQILVDPLQEWLYAINYAHAELYFYSIRNLDEPSLVATLPLAAPGVQVRAATLLAGGISLMIGSSDGHISQWFPLRDAEGHYRLQQVRSFEHNGVGDILGLIPEQRRRGFMTLDSDGQLGVFYATSERNVMHKQFGQAALVQGAIAPRANIMLLEGSDQTLRVVRMHNEHPEISFKALWGKIWYESYQEPAYTWQSSSASGDFEPKFSLAPLAFGTLKAAFYAMLFAVPLALAGAIYTAYFMSSGMRQLVKPTIEVMEALPTVILGFLAGLWLAPFVENYLPGVFLLILFLPLSMPLTGWLWTRMPQNIQHAVPTGWQPAILVLPLLVSTALAMSLSGPVELLFFDGSLPLWLDHELGITYDQRNSLVVGLAMGFAVIPTIFSIAEDAVFSVPKQLSQGSLALGATPWQTLVRVILPTASPGIFSALMIGLGCAVGETMIVLMATGNTPIMDVNIFEGFRTLSANIAVEMPESEVGSSHYRILFLAGLVLFLFTFVFNTLAEIIRQRLRNKYSTL